LNATQTPAGSSASANNGKATKSKRHVQSADARWNKRFQTENEVREYFLNCDKNEGLEALQTLRKHTEIAATAYDENMQRGVEEKCGNCGLVFGHGQVYSRRTVVKDPDTQKSHNVFSCSLACYVAQFGKAGNPQVQGR